MLLWTIQTTIISIILIFMVHNLIFFFKSTLTVPKFKDLVNSPSQKYEEMFNIISQSKSQYNNLIDTKNEKDDKYLQSLLPPSIPPINSMKNELKSFLKSTFRKNETKIQSFDDSSQDLHSF
jgi:hypothetical protein